MPVAMFSCLRAMNAPWKGGCGGLLSLPSVPGQGRAACRGEGRLHPSHTAPITPLYPFPSLWGCLVPAPALPAHTQTPSAFPLAVFNLQT